MPVVAGRLFSNFVESYKASHYLALETKFDRSGSFLLTDAWYIFLNNSTCT